MEKGETSPEETSAAALAAEQVASLPAHYFELYSLAVEMADRTSARRLTANSFFLTVNTSLAALLGAHAFQWYVAVAGIILCIAWGALLTSYQRLNSAKFNVINAMEKQFSTRIFTDEWGSLKRDPVKLAVNRKVLKEWLGQYWELGVVERIVPGVFALIYLANLASRL